MRALKEQANIVYEPTIIIHHKITESAIQLTPFNRLQSKNRARGTGALYAKHDLSIWVIARGLLAPILRPLVKGQFTHELTDGVAQTLGRYQGWWYWNRQNHHNAASRSTVRDD